MSNLWSLYQPLQSLTMFVWGVSALCNNYIQSELCFVSSGVTNSEFSFVSENLMAWNAASGQIDVIDRQMSQMDVIDRCHRQTSQIDAIDRCHGQMSQTDVIDRCHIWMSYTIDECRRWMSQIHVVDGCRRWMPQIGRCHRQMLQMDVIDRCQDMIRSSIWHLSWDPW